MSVSYRLFEFDVYDNLIEDKDPMWDNKEFQVQMFGINETGETACILVSGFKPFFYIQVEDSWGQGTKTTFMSELKKFVGPYYEESIVSSKIEKHKRLYGFDAGKKYKFIKIEFHSVAALNKAKKMWYDDTKNADGEFERVLKVDGFIFENSPTFLYEAQIPPLLRLFHIKEISPSGWIELNIRDTIPRKNRKTTCKYEYEIDYDKITPLPNKETPVPYKICSFDIEASSSHGDFPLAKKNYKRLAINIADIWYKERLRWTQAGEASRQEIADKLKRIILSAFGHDNYKNVDIIYTKSHVTKEQAETIFENWIKVLPAKDKFSDYIEQMNDPTISNMYQDHMYQVSDYNIDDYDVDDDDETELDNDLCNDDGKIEETGADADTSIRKFKKARPKKYTNKTGTIIDLMDDTKCARDTKIQELTRTLSKLFPEVQGDKVTFIGSTFYKFGAKEEYLNNCIVLNGCEIPKNVKHPEIKTCKREEQVLLEWTKLIKREDPDIIIGYNINGFDFDFMDKRAQELDCREKFLELSRNNKEVCLKYDWKTKRKDIEQSKILIASGEYNLRIINMTGRLQIDLFNYFRREYQLSSYKLDYVSGYFIGDGVIKIEHRAEEENDIEIIRAKTIIYSKNLKGLCVGSFISFEETSHSVDYYKEGQKFEVREIDLENKSFTIYGIENPDMKKKVRWGLAKDDISPQEIFKLGDGSDEDRSIIAKYCIKDCKNVLDLLLKIDVITGYIEMAKLCSVPKSFLVMRGQGIKLTSYVGKKCREKGTLMPVIARSLDDDGYEGAIVLEPKCNLYLKDPIACVDYSSLYPSSMISENISHDSKVWSREYDLDGNEIKDKVQGEQDKDGNFIYDNLPEYKYVDIQYDTFQWQRKTPSAAATKVKVGYKICRFAQFNDGNLGILPALLEELLAARKATKKMMAKEEDPFMKNILDKRQLAIKVTANSCYGATGAKTSTFYEKDVAASTTATGRKLLLYGKSVIEEAYKDKTCELKDGTKVKTDAEVVYGDTDSVFFKFNLKDMDGNPIIGKEALKMTIELAQEAGQLATMFLKKPHDLEYEKTFLNFCLLSKKRYVGMLYEFNPDKGNLKSMGLVLKRRDNANIVKDIYGEVIDILMKGGNVKGAIEFVRKSLGKIIKGEYPMEKLIVTKSLRSNYKNPQQIGHKVLADRMGERDPGNKPKSGDRIPYVFIENPNKKALQGDKIEHPTYILENEDIVKINYAHYITNQIMKPLQQLFALVLDDMEEFQEKYIKGTGKSKSEDKSESEVRKTKWDKELEKLNKWTDEEKYRKKLDELRAKKIKELIFDEYLDKLK